MLGRRGGRLSAEPSTVRGIWLQRLVVGVNLNESRTRNFAEELRRQGYQVEEFRIARLGELLARGRKLLGALRRADFVLMGPSIPWGLVVAYLARILETPVVLDCPMDIAEWPFAPARRYRRMVGILLRSVKVVLTIETRRYFKDKYRLSEGVLVFVESCPDEKSIAEARRSNPRFTKPPGSFVVCCSGGAVQHRLERFLPVFEKLTSLVPHAILLVVADPLQPLAIAAEKLKARPELSTKIVISPIINSTEEFFATMLQIDLWVATLGDDTIQGARELRMELLAVAQLGRPIVAVKTEALLHHGFEDDSTIIYIDPEPGAAAAKLAALAVQPERLEQIGTRLKEIAVRRFSLREAAERIIGSVSDRSLRSPVGRRGGR